MSRDRKMRWEFVDDVWGLDVVPRQKKEGMQYEYGSRLRSGNYICFIEFPTNVNRRLCSLN